MGTGVNDGRGVTVGVAVAAAVDDEVKGAKVVRWAIVMTSRLFTRSCATTVIPSVNHCALATSQ